jgi:preprotein translocase subunit SecE
LNPAKFAREVKQEARRVVWPTRKETLLSTAMVLAMVIISGLFFVMVDSIISAGIQWILGMGG